MPSPWRCTQGAVIALALLVGSACRKETPVPAGDIAASLTLPTIDDTDFDPGFMRGKPAIVVFASPTCPHCIAELPLAQKAANSADANIVAVFVAGSKEKIASAATAAKYNGHVLIDDGTLRKRYGIEAVPYTLVLGPDGKATRAFRGEQTEATLRAALADVR